MIVIKPKVVGICVIDFNFPGHIKCMYSCCIELSFHVGCSELNCHKLIFLEDLGCILVKALLLITHL
jgi:hypothetical protein